MSADQSSPQETGRRVGAHICFAYSIDGESQAYNEVVDEFESVVAALTTAANGEAPWPVFELPDGRPFAVNPRLVESVMPPRRSADV